MAFSVASEQSSNGQSYWFCDSVSGADDSEQSVQLEGFGVKEKLHTI